MGWFYFLIFYAFLKVHFVIYAILKIIFFSLLFCIYKIIDLCYNTSVIFDIMPYTF